MNVSIIRTSTSCVLVSVLGLLLNGCIVVGPGPHPHARIAVEASVPMPVVAVPDGVTVYVDDAHPGVVRDYYYYPSAQVYFDPIATSWFWMEGGRWRNGRALPPRYHIDERDRRAFRSDARQPYVVHDRVRARVNSAPPAPRGVPAPPVPRGVPAPPVPRGVPAPPVPRY